jgi:hypothetical protein
MNAFDSKFQIDTDWDTIINDDDTTNNVCINFTNKFLTIAKENIPLKTILVRHHDKSWISSELKMEIRKRDRLRQQFLRLKTISTEQKYKSQRNKVNTIKKQCKVSYFEKISELLSDLKTTNIQLYWRTVKQLLKNHSPTYSLPPT